MHRRAVVILAAVPIETLYIRFLRAVAEELARLEWEVLWVSSPVSPRSGIGRWATTFPNGRIGRVGQLWYLRPSGVPAARLPIVSRIRDVIVSRQVRRAIRRIGGETPTALLFADELATLDRIPHRGSVYWAGDNGPNLPRGRAVTRRCDLAATIGELPASWVREVDPAKARMVTTGVDTSHFDPARVTGPIPDDLRDLPRPIVGFVGTLSDLRVDIDLIVQVAEANPGATVAVIGPSADSGRDHLERLAPSNVRILGAKPYEEIPRYIAGLDVGIVPYLPNDFNRGAMPLKTFEYLAMGLPVVATDLPATQMLEPAIAVARSPEGFVRLVGEALDRLDELSRPDQIAARRALAESYGVPVVARRLSEILEEAAAMHPAS